VRRHPQVSLVQQLRSVDDGPVVFTCRGAEHVPGSANLRAGARANVTDPTDSADSTDSWSALERANASGADVGVGAKVTDPGITKSKIFCLGPGKTGTETLKDILSTLQVDVCHNNCEDTDDAKLGKLWGEERSTSSPLLQHHQAFMDNGELTDIKWLADNYNDARFVMNNRPLRDWVMSKYDMTRENREGAGCAPEGDKTDCPVGKQRDGQDTEMVNNDPASMALMIRTARDNQAEVLKYLEDNEEAQRRFVSMDVCSAPMNETMMRLLWVVRADPSLSEVLGIEKEWPDDVVKLYSELADQAGIQSAQANTREHDESVVKRVAEIIEEIGCGGMEDLLWYEDCVKKIDEWENAGGGQSESKDQQQQPHPK